MTNPNALSPPPCNPEEIPSDLKCSICLGIPLFPALTPCEHIFCNGCIRRASKNGQRHSCPICRTTYETNELKDLQKGTFIYRLWSNIRVNCTRCEEGCTWSGSIEDFPIHFKNMHITKHEKMIYIMKEYIEELERKEASWKAERKKLSERIKEQEKKHMWEIDKLKVANLLLEEKYDKLLASSQGKTKIKHKFAKDNVAKLSRQISYNAQKKLHSKDADKIFKHVKTYYEALQRNDPDNPENYETEVMTLLKTCSSSKCFSKEQKQSIDVWINDELFFEKLVMMQSSETKDI